MIKIESELKEWLVNYITNTIRNTRAENSEEFNNWAIHFKKDLAEFEVNAEFANDWGYDERDEIPEKEAEEYADCLIERLCDNWSLFK